MMSQLLATLFTVAILDIVQGTLARTVWSFQNDLSEHCRRRVMPSIFLGEQVTQSNSQMLHFGQLELPYSCFITVRTEAGNNIILVISLPSGETLKQSCQKYGDQLLVFEMGETFGGYWGPLATRLIDESSKKRLRDKRNKKYTLLTTTKPTTTLKRLSRKPSEEDSETEEGTEVTTTSSKHQTLTEEDEIVVEIPLMNVSVHLEPDDKVHYRANEDQFEESFDLFHDVMPRPGEKYDTKIVPIVQLSIEKGSGRVGNAPRYQLDYNLDESPNGRRYNKIKTTRQSLFKAVTRSYYRRQKLITKLRNITPSSQAHKRTRERTRPRYSTFSYRHLSSYANKLKTSSKNRDNEPQLTSNDRSAATTETYAPTQTDSWQHVVNLMKIMKTMTDNGEILENQKVNVSVSDVKGKISNMKHNLSIYLEPDLDLYVKYSEPVTKFSRQPVTAKFNFSTFTRTPLKFSKLMPTEVTFSTYFKPKTSITDTISKEIDFEKVDTSVPNSTNGSTPTTPNMKALFEFSETKNIEDIKTDKEFLNKSKNNDPDDSRQGDENYSDLYEGINNDSSPINSPEISEGQKNLTVLLNQIKYNKDFIQTTTTAIDVNVNPSTNNNATVSNKKPVQNIPIVSGSMVDHESWENVVQAAPEMALILNKTANQPRDSLKSVLKRNVESIPIVDAIPHKTTTKKRVKIKKKYKEDASESAAASLEPVDDEIHGRINFRRLLKYVGPVYFNICDYQEAKERQVKIFNASKIVVALLNFTLEQMTLVTTSAHKLSRSEPVCPEYHLECQIEGERVCIDANCACDNVPNCGSYEIYDEDRLQCGIIEDTHYSLYIAAFTFIAVILTFLYTIHYWLKRCVPKVSEAFFVYTAGTENVLFLDSVMRSPNEIDNVSKLIFHSDFLEEDLLLNGIDRRSFWKKFLNLCISKCRKKRPSSFEITTEQKSEVRKMYSFAELELKKMSLGQLVTDKGVQTGESLEMPQLNIKKFRTEDKEEKSSKQKGSPPIETESQEESASDAGEFMNIMDISRQKDDLKELKMLQILKDARASKPSYDSPANQSINTVPSEQSIRIVETELRTMHYDKPTKIQTAAKMKPSNIALHEKLPESSSQIKKRLRFEEKTTTIPSTSYELKDGVPTLADGRRSVTLVANKAKRGLMGLGKIEEDSGQGTTNMTLDFKRFWTKKTKKHGSKRSK